MLRRNNIFLSCSINSEKKSEGTGKTIERILTIDPNACIVLLGPLKAQSNFSIK